MTESPIPRILLLEADEKLAARASDILEDQGWNVTCLKVSKEALTLLENSKSSPFDLFISSYRLPKMAGDDVLEAARRLSPLTQRMLLVPSDQPDIVISAINKAEINACIVTPASDNDLIDRVRTCLTAFTKARKFEQLKRVTVHQNKQLFGIAQKLKKKGGLSQSRISEKKAEILLLRSKLQQNKSGRVPETLEQILTSLNLSMEPQDLKQAFLNMEDYIHALIDSAIAKSGIERPKTRPRFTPAPETDEPEPQEETPLESLKLIESILKLTLTSSDKPAAAETADEFGPLETEDREVTLEDMVEIQVSEEKTKAFINCRFPLADPGLLTLQGLLDLLREKGIGYGILDDEDIEQWIAAPPQDDTPFCIARGDDPVLGKDGSVSYEFETEYTNPGKIMEDGRIDFRDRGEIPYVSKKDLLATRVLPVQGKNGMSVFGEVIEVDEPFDPVFIAGSGTKLSEDQTAITATLDGQPHMDHLGEISVNPELPIDGDVDFKTGNIDFKGNIIVSGTVKEGFTVKGINLTAKEIEGATIDITGDLQISDGITDANIISSGNIYAKFINNSSIKAYGKLAIQKEIIDSKILISGECENTSGIIIASQITAKGGVVAGKIGTEASKPAHLKVGTNDHLDHLTQKVEEQLKRSVDRLQEIRKKIAEVEDKDKELYGRITEKAQAQEAAQNQMAELMVQIKEMKNTNDQAGLSQTLARYKKAEQIVKTAEQDLNEIFEIQDRFAKEIEQFRSMTDHIENTNKQLVLKRKGLKDCSEKAQAHPRVRVQQTITQETKISGPNVSHTLREDRSRCQIYEKTLSEEGLHFHEMEITDL